MAFPQYGGGGYGYGDEAPVANYNPRTHFQAAQNNGFACGGDDAPRTLYVGNLDQSVTEDFLLTLFGQIGVVTKSKVIYDGTNDPYAFVEFGDPAHAAAALTAMNKRLLLDREMKVNWATEPGSTSKVDTSKHFHVFVGDLSTEIDNKQLKEAFQGFGDISEAKVIRDALTQKSKGYGFVSFPKRDEAERAIEQMNGQWLGRRAIRTNWATRKPNEHGEMVGGGGSGGGGRRELNYDDIYNQTSADNTSVYVGNVPQQATEDDIKQAFYRFGNIAEIRNFKAQGYTFVKFETKEAACRAICGMSGGELLGQSIKCSWGKTSDNAKKDTYGSGAYGYGNYGQQGGGGGQQQQGGGGQWYGGGGNNYGNGGGGYGGGGNGGGQGGANGGGAANANAVSAHQQYMQYYQQYYQQNPQAMQQWAQYYQQHAQNGQGKQ